VSLVCLAISTMALSFHSSRAFESRRGGPPTKMAMSTAAMQRDIAAPVMASFFVMANARPHWRGAADARYVNRCALPRSVQAVVGLS
jgi:hypothetical protein